MAKCRVCFRECEIGEGQAGFCGVRVCKGGQVIPSNYGRVTALALDPIEKKPLRRFRPGSKILSVGSFGCNLRCPFCQNNSISWSREALALANASAELLCGASQTVKSGGASQTVKSGGAMPAFVSPEKLAELALDCAGEGNIGVAFTYNEPLVGYEYVRDAAKAVRANGQVNVMVTNGTAGTEVLEELLPWIDAMNVDLKGFSDRYYEEVLGGNRRMVMNFIERAAEECHVEVTTLVVPGENDSETEIEEMARWIAGVDPEIPLHLSRFFPQFHMTDRGPTEVDLVYRLVEVAGRHLKYVYPGNC